MDMSGPSVFMAVAGCALAALGVHTLVTGRLSYGSKRRRARLRPRPRGLGQLLMGLGLALLPLSSALASPSSALYHVVFFASAGCLVAGICSLCAAMAPHRRP
ncbi:hypothetical protein Nocox_30870 [Nonomuraea coxensis DSM 45129]|uniref:Uncharacterized protein n=1 Tax=Nonomuraea coxensis DSM 45129 TaxID=1122611 RepID=A0ABX8UA00_9ACTN|nr:hypothetical protein [Nonomuraea coxensis]QYC43756.1 hypothetical protein Nocox_30870 [Nonomuraea coxensis DSM 45129]